MSDVPPEVDLKFYKNFYPDMFPMSDADALNHWMDLGLKEGRTPSWEAHLEKNPDIAARKPTRFSVVLYKYLNPDLADKFREDWQFIQHYIDYGQDEGRRYEVEGDAFISELYPNEDGGLEAAVSREAKIYRNLTDVLHQNGITSDSFLADFNFGDYLTLNGNARLKNAMQCIRHFAESGRFSLCPIAVDYWFDATFYIQQMARAPALPAEAYLHWINIGQPLEIKPNRTLLLKSLGLRDLSALPDSFDHTVYIALNSDLTGKFDSRWDALRHFIHNGALEEREGAPDPEVASDIYLAAADRLAIANRLGEAKKIYRIVLSADPSNGFAIQHYGDCLLKLGEYFEAVQIYRVAIGIGKASVWTYINLSHCYTEIGRLKAAAEVLTNLSLRLPGDMAIARRVDEARLTYYKQKEGEANRIVSKGLFPAAQRRMAEAASILSAPISVMYPEAIKARKPIQFVAIVAETSLAQCRFYRVEQKVEHLKAAGLRVTMYDHNHDLGRFTGDLAYLDAVIFYRVPSTPSVIKVIEQTRAAGVPSFYEIDDLVFDEQYFPDSFESYGGQIDQEVYARLITGTGLFRTAMSLCDYALSSTPKLAEEMQRYVISGHAFVHRNALSSIHLSWIGKKTENMDRAVDDPIRIFYGTATKAHNDDFDLCVAPTLARLFRRYGDKISLIIIGYLTLPACLEPHYKNISLIEPIWDLNVYWNTVLQMDINLAVLKPGLIADCKSEIKWIEAAMLGIPSVVSRTANYASVIKNGVDGILVEKPDEWYKALDGLIRNPARRRQMGEAALRSVRATYSIEASARNLVSIFNEITCSGAKKDKAKVRVLIVNVFFPPQAIGGATRVVSENVRDLIRENKDEVDIQVFTTTEGGEEPYAFRTYDWHGIKVTAVTAPNDAKVDLRSEDTKMGEIFGHYLDEYKPHLVHFHCIQRLTGTVCQVTKLRLIPYLITVHDGWWISDNQFLLDDMMRVSLYRYQDPARQLMVAGPESLYRMQKLASYLGGAEQILAVSEPFAAIYRSCGFANVCVVENGVSDFVVKTRTRSSTGHVRIGHIGGAALHKGFNLLKAALVTSDFQSLSLLAVDHALPPGTETVDMWGSTPVRFRAKISQSDIALLYADLDVLIAPSVWPESYGLVVREALRAGCWVVASNRGAIAQEVTSGNGFVVGVEGIEDLRHVLGEINVNPGRYLGPIETIPIIRPSSDQAADLAEIYLRYRAVKPKGNGHRHKVTPDLDRHVVDARSPVSVKVDAARVS